MPPPSAADIDALISTGPKEASIPQLEAYLEAQVAGTVAYHSRAVRTLVKSYQLFSTNSSTNNSITQACFLGLLESNNNGDFLALSYMIPTATQKTEPLATIFACHKQLTACQFAEFWKTYATLTSNNNSSIAPLAQASIPRLRASIVSVLQLTYRTAPLKVVLEALNTSNPDDIQGAKSIQGDVVTFDGGAAAANNDEQQAQQVYKENAVTFKAIHALMSK